MRPKTLRATCNAHARYLCKAWAGEGKKLAPQVTAKTTRHCCTLPLRPAGIALSQGCRLLRQQPRCLPEGRMLL